MRSRCKVAGGYQLGTSVGQYLERFLEEEVSGGCPGGLGDPGYYCLQAAGYALEIESIRGVKCEYVLEALLKRRLIKISGRKKRTSPALQCQPRISQIFWLRI